MTIGKAVLQIRQGKGMTQRAVGARAHLAPSYISRIENNRIQPTMATLGRVAEALEVPVSAIFRLGERGGQTPLHRCPVSASGDCIGELIRSPRGRRPRGGRAPYGKEELDLLRMTDYVVTHSSKEVRTTLTVLLESLLARESKGSPGRRGSTSPVA